MQTEWISTGDNNRLILYFAGWGTSPELVKNWQIPTGYDLLLCWDYRTFQLDSAQLNFDFSRYQHYHLVAWSMGVWAAEQCAEYSFLQNVVLETSVAINGTPLLIDDEQGIPNAIFKGTLDGFNDLTRTKFERRMCGNRALLQQYQTFATRPTAEIKQELTAVNAAVLHSKTLSSRISAIKWQKAIVGTQDLIFPTANQLHYWQQSSAQIEQIAAPHFLFPLLNGWSELCC